jgi:hypothetical protein
VPIPGTNATESSSELNNDLKYSNSIPNELNQYHIISHGDAEVLGNFRALNFYRTSDMRIKFDSQKLADGTRG